MIRKRDVIGFLVGVVVALAILTFVIQRTNNVQNHVCESTQKVRDPLRGYIDSEIRIVKEAQRRHIPLGPPALKPLQDESFRNLVALDHALHAAIVSGCSA